MAEKLTYNTVQVRGGKYFAVAVNLEGKILSEKEFDTHDEAAEFVRKSMTYA